MTQSTFSSDEPVNQEELMSAIFAHMVLQQSNMAMMLLGKVAHPQTGQTMTDFDGARMFIDQLEMLEAKTKGNLNKEEDALLKQTLMSLRMTFVESVEAGAKDEPPLAPGPAPSFAHAAPEAAENQPAASPIVQPDEEEHRKKFTKKY
jgi:hypothetical protein